MIVQCPDCGKSVSDQAPACPGCGCPIASSVSTENNLVTVQETGKSLKLNIILSSLIFWAAAVWFIGFSLSGKQNGIIFSAIAMLVGLTWYIITRFQIWWHHK